MIKLTGNPKSTQTIYRSACRGGFATTYMTREGKALKEQYFWEVKSQWKKPMIKGNVKLEVKLYFGDKKKRDIDNFNKLVIDSLTGIVFEDDSQITELNLTKLYDKELPRIELEVAEITLKLSE